MSTPRSLVYWGIAAPKGFSIDPMGVLLSLVVTSDDVKVLTATRSLPTTVGDKQATRRRLAAGT